MIPFLLPLVLWFAPEGQSPQQPAEEAPREAKAKGLEVMRVLPDSQAQKLKFQPGDILVAYNSTPLNTFQDLREALKKAKATGNIIQVFRGGKIYHLKVDAGKLGLELAER